MHVNFLYFCKMQEYVKKNPPPWIVFRVPTSVVGGLWGLAMPPNLALGPLTCLELCCQVQTNDIRLPECDPLHERRCRRHLEGGNGRIGSTRGGYASRLGPNLVLKCSYGLTCHNQVGKYISQRSSGESQRPRSSGQPG